MILDGQDLVLFTSQDEGVTWDAFANATSHTLSVSMATRDTSNKNSGKFRKLAPGRLSWSGGSEGLVDYSGNCDYHTLMDLILNRTKIMIASAVNDADSPDESLQYYKGSVYLTSVEKNSADGDNVSYSVSFEGADDLIPVSVV